jgi:hypothetical protein
MEKRQRLGKEREIMECVKDIFLNSFPHPKKAITYQLYLIQFGSCRFDCPKKAILLS